MVFVATSFEGQPYVRPMTLINSPKGFFLATGSNDNKTRQIAVNPKVEICRLSQNETNSGYIRARGILEQINDQDLRTSIYTEVGFLKKYWSDPSSQDYVLYKMIWLEVDFMKPGDDLAVTIPW